MFSDSMAARRLNPEEEMMVASFEMLGLGGSKQEEEKFVLTMPQIEKRRICHAEGAEEGGRGRRGMEKLHLVWKETGSKRCSP